MKNWNDDLAINLSAPFFISQIVFKKMQKKGGKIIFTSTSSANKEVVKILLATE